MLQQTRVEAVLERYRRFVDRLPDVDALAAATEEEVVALWSGLGYYRRARALRLAAQAIVREHGGRFPRTREELLELPGVGPYTAGALLSIAFQRSAPLVDGNVVRVLSRLFAIDLEPGSARDRRIWSLAAELVPPDVDAEGPGPTVSPRNFNQALMELGALVCSPRGPRCEACPVSGSCRALASGRVGELPVKPSRPAPVDVELESLLVRRGDRVLLERRGEAGRMAGLLELPTRELAAPDAEPHLWPRDFARAFQPAEELGRLSHAITHHRIRSRVRAASSVGRIAAPFLWADLAAVDELGLTGLARKALARFASPSPPKVRR